MKKILLVGLLWAPTVFALEALDSAELDAVHGQGGVYLTGEFTINKEGGPLWSTTAGTVDEFGGAKQVRNCGTSGQPKECGARLAFKVESGTQDGWIVWDDITGSFAFEGLTLRTRSSTINGEQKSVLELGLPSQVRTKEFRYTFAASNSGEWSPASQQTNILSVHQNGNVNLQGSLLIYPLEVQ